MTSHLPVAKGNMTRPKVDPDKRQRTACACDSCKRRKQKVSIFSPSPSALLPRSSPCVHGTLAQPFASPSSYIRSHDRVVTVVDSVANSAQWQVYRLWGLLVQCLFLTQYAADAITTADTQLDSQRHLVSLGTRSRVAVHNAGKIKCKNAMLGHDKEAPPDLLYRSRPLRPQMPTWR